LRTHWVLVVMDQHTRRIVGFGVQRGVVDGVGLCRMFNRATCGQTPPTYVSSDHDPLYRYHQWQANLRILDVKEIKTIPYVPLSHPFVERLIGTIRRECLDRTLYWTTDDLELKLLDFQRLLQRAPHACTADRAHARLKPGPRPRERQFVSLAGALSWAVSDTDRRLTRGQRRWGACHVDRSAAALMRVCQSEPARIRMRTMTEREFFSVLFAAQLGIRHRQVSIH
jgi:hypothetical protein